MSEVRVKSENLFELAPEMWDASNWIDTYLSTSSYFMYYKLSDQQKNRLKDIGRIAGTVYLHRGGQHTYNEILAITSEIKNTNVTTEERLLLNDGTVRNYTTDVSDYDNIYLCIGYGYGYTPTNKQDLIRNLFNNYDVMLNEGNTALPYQPYFLNLPSHKKTSTGWKDIPTHKMTTTGWQGELTSQSPLEFRATGQSLLDWRVDGASGGVGDWDETEQKYVIPVTVNGTTTNLYTTAQLMDGDSLDYTTDQTSIPITQGDNTLTVLTQVQPSKVFVKFEG